MLTRLCAWETGGRASTAPINAFMSGEARFTRAGGAACRNLTNLAPALFDGGALTVARAMVYPALLGVSYEGVLRLLE